jgi:urease accessory protein
VSTSPVSVASVRFRAGIGGEPILQEMHASAAHAFQPGRSGATIVGAAAHPVAGDHLGLQVEVGVGCCAEIRSSGATVARRGSHQPAWSGPSGSSLEVRANVASDAMLTWRPEAGVAADGCQHLVGAIVELAASARLLWRDEFLIERRDDAGPGTWSSRLRVVRDGWPVVCTELAVGPGSPLWESPAVLEGARAVSLMVVVDPEQTPQSWRSSRATDASATGVALPLAGPGVQIVAWGDELSDCRATIERMVGHCGAPEWAATRWLHGWALDVVG